MRIIFIPYDPPKVAGRPCLIGVIVRINSDLLYRLYISLPIREPLYEQFINPISDNTIGRLRDALANASLPGGQSSTGSEETFRIFLQSEGFCIYMKSVEDKLSVCM